MNKNQSKSPKSMATIAASSAAATTQTIRENTLEMTESMAYEMTQALLAEQYNEGGYLAFIQAMWGFVQRYDAVVGDAEKQGIDEKICRAIGATDIALTFIPEMRNELAKLAAQ